MTAPDTASAPPGLVPSYRAMFDLEGEHGAADVAVVGNEQHVGRQLRSFADAALAKNLIRRGRNR